MINLLNKIGEDTLIKNNITSTVRIKFYEDIINIVYYNQKKIEIENRIVENRVSNSIKNAYLFLKEINPIYGEEFLKAYYEGKIKTDISNKTTNKRIYIDKNQYFEDYSSLNIKTPSMRFYTKTGEKEIYYPVDKRISDTEALIHEFIHYITKTKENYLMYSSIYFVETPSIASEYIYESLNPNINGIYEVGTRNLESMFNNTKISKIKVEFLKQIIINGEINIPKLTNTLNIDEYDLIKTIYIILNSNNMDIYKEFGYILGTLTSFDSINSIEKLDHTIKLLKDNPNKLYNYLKLDNNGYRFNSEVLDRLEENFTTKIDERNKKIIKKNRG